MKWPKKKDDKHHTHAHCTATDALFAIMQPPQCLRCQYLGIIHLPTGERRMLLHGTN